MGVSVMDGTIRIRSVAWFATAIVLAVVCTLLVTQAWSAGAAPGDSDSTFVPTAGCRIADTRPAPNTVGLRSAPLGAGDTFEVTIKGEPDTAYEFRSSVDLQFAPTTLVTNLTPGDPESPGTLSRVTTGGSGDARVRMTLTETRSFIIAQLH